MDKTNKKFKPTLKDIALKADVSTAAVSLVLKDIETKRVSPAKRLEIIEIAKNFNYRPNQIARALVGKKSYTIGLIVNTLVIPFYSEIAQDIIAQAKKNGYSVLISSTQELRSLEKSRINEERQLIYNLVDRGVDGLIICSALRDDPVIAEVHEMGIPFVLALRDVKRGPKDQTFDYVGIDNKLGGYLATEHFLKMDHKEIAVITGDREVTSSHERLAGTLEAFKAFGVNPDHDLILNGEYKREVSYQVTSAHFKKKRNTTAMVVHSDYMAMGVLEALRDANIKVPDEVAVIGFDDTEMAGLPGVDLTTISQEKSTIGKIAADLLIEKIREQTNHLARRFILTPILVIRRTCGFRAMNAGQM